MESKKVSYVKIIKTLFVILSIVQAVFGTVWFFANLTTISNDVDELLYLEASKNIVIDDWQSIFYVFFLFVIRMISFGSDKVFVAIVYVVQFFTLVFAAHVVSRVYFKTTLYRHIFVTYVISFPLILHEIASISPFAIRAAALLLVTSGFVNIAKKRKRTALISYLVIALMLLLVANRAIATINAYGRTERSASFLLCNHTIWPHVSESSYYLGNYITETHEQDFNAIDADSYRMVTDFGRWIEEEYPDKDTLHYHFRWLAKSTFKAWPRSTVTSAVKEWAEYVFTPFTVAAVDFFNIKNTSEPNVHALFTKNLEGLSSLYHKTGTLGFLLLTIMTIPFFKGQPGKVIGLICSQSIIAFVVWFTAIRGFDYRQGTIISVIWITFIFRLLSMNNIEE